MRASTAVAVAGRHASLPLIPSPLIGRGGAHDQCARWPPRCFNGAAIDGAHSRHAMRDKTSDHIKSQWLSGIWSGSIHGKTDGSV
jgi:hypothetical protein